MKTRRIATLLLGICLLSAPLAAYEFGGGSTPTTECNNGVDDDGDGKTDENDPGCSRPYYEDDTEDNVYDPYAGWIFSGNSTPTGMGPSVFYPSTLKYTGGSTAYPDGSDGSSYLNETYVENADQDEGWAESWTKIEKPTGWGVKSNSDGQYYFIDTPWPGSEIEDDTCGDGIVQDYEHTNNCVQDAGLPDDKGNSTSSISDELGTYSVSDEHGNNHKDKVNYTLDMVASEYTTEGSSCSGLSDVECVDITSLSSDKTRTLEDTWSNAPDFALKESNTAIYAVYPETSTVTVDTVTNDELGSSSTVADYSSAGTKKFSCSGPDCELTGESYCTDVNPKSKDDYTLEEKSTRITYNSKEYSTSPSGDHDYSVDTSDQKMTIQVTYNNAKKGSIDYNSCSQTEPEVNCPSGGDCSLGDGKKYYTSSDKSYNGDFTPYDKTYKIKTLSIKDKNIFDLDPKGANEFSISEKKALFKGDFNDLSRVHSNSYSGEGFFGYAVPGSDIVQSNNFGLSVSQFEIDAGSGGDLKSDRRSKNTYSADGSRGQGDGYIAIQNGQIAGSTPNFLSKELGNGGSTDFISTTDVANSLDISCPGDSTKCVASVDVSFNNLSSWSDPTNPATGVKFEYSKGNPYTLDASLGACKMYKRLNNDINAHCNEDYGGSYTGSGSYSGGACGDQPYEYYVYMEGPEVDEDTMQDYPSHYERCIDTSKSGVTKSSCINKGDVVPEGHVENVAPNPEYSNAKYEEGGNSPDWEVCLDLEGTGIGDEGDEVSGDNENDDLSQEDYGGEWYDLDSEMAQQYLRGVEDGTYSTASGDKLVSDGDPSDPHDIAYYWNSQINPPQDGTYNPQGGRAGIALEDDCGNTRFDSLRCDDQAASNDRGHGATSTFFSFFKNRLKDEDYHPQGDQNNDGNQKTGFTGVVNRLQEMSNQLEPGMDTNTYDESDYTKWESTRGAQYADSWAISKYPNWSIDSTGTPYPPFSAWYRDPGDIRTSPSSPSVSKMAKAFGNSYSAVAVNSFSYSNEDGQTIQVEPGDGIWIDPDSMKTASNVKLTPEGAGWRTALSREDPRTGVNNGMKIDISGDDAGLAMDVDSNEECLSTSDDGGCQVVAADMDWERDSSGNLKGELERPMCGDDRLEYLVEQAGESESSTQYSGPYACSTSVNSCYDSSAPEGERLVDQGGYRDVDEPGEDDGRLKNDAEICQKKDGQDDYAVWYDQDYRSDFCRENTLYGQDGVRWFDEQYVADYPQAVRGGIDDSWNNYLAQQGHKSYESDTTATSSEVTVDGDTTPVSTGTFDDKTATLGFCGGDDESEYLVTQDCNTRYCETDRSVQGVAKVPGSCVLRAEGGTYETDVSERSIFQPGEQVTVTSVSGNPEIACFNGAWFADWPVSFYEEEVEVPLGQTRTASFDVINIRNTETTFRVTMEESSESPSADQFAEFVSQSGDSFTTTVKPTSSKSFTVEFTGGNENLDIGDPGSPLTIRAEGINSGLVGSDSVDVGIEPSSDIASEETGSTRDVPGVGSLQLIAMMLISTLVFFTRRRS